jgi:hypothetical protein
MTLSREQFFRDTLIPTGTLAEIFIQAASDKGMNKKYGGRIGMLIWEPLNLLSCYALAKQEPEPETLPLLHNEVLVISARIQQWLTQMTTGRVSAYDFIHGQFSPEKLREQVGTAVNRIYVLLKYDIHHPNKWFAEYQSRMYSIGTRDSMGKWRTFARNFEPERTVDTLKLPAVYKAAAKRLTSRCGVEKVMTLWYQCFPVERTPAVAVELPVAQAASPAKRTPSPSSDAPAVAKVEVANSGTEPVWTEETLPTFVSVSSGPSGMLEVSAVFDPSTQVKLKSEVKKPLPVAMRKRFVKRNKVITCPYRDLSQAVDEITLWYRAECLEAAQLDQEYTMWAESFLSKDLLERLRKNFTEAEIPLLLREMTRQQTTQA